MIKEILEIIKNNIEKIDEKVEQVELSKEFFILSEQLKSGPIYDIVMDAFLLAKYNEYDKNLCSRNKKELSVDIDNILRQGSFS